MGILGKNSESVTLRQLIEADIVRLLMTSDGVEESEVLKLCDNAGRQMGQYSGCSARAFDTEACAV